MNHRKQKILDDISKKEVFLEKFFMYWYDGEYDGKRESNYIEEFENEGDFDLWREDPQRLRDEKIDHILDISKKNTIGDILPKDFENN
jgi:hypothetical protein